MTTGSSERNVGGLQCRMGRGQRTCRISEPFQQQDSGHVLVLRCSLNS